MYETRIDLLEGEEAQCTWNFVGHVAFSWSFQQHHQHPWSFACNPVTSQVWRLNGRIVDSDQPGKFLIETHRHDSSLPYSVNYSHRLSDFLLDENHTIVISKHSRRASTMWAGANCTAKNAVLFLRPPKCIKRWSFSKLPNPLMKQQVTIFF